MSKGLDCASFGQRRAGLQKALSVVHHTLFIDRCKSVHAFKTFTYVPGYSSGVDMDLVDLDLGICSGWWAATVAAYCPSRMMELPKSKSTQPNVQT